MITRLSRYFSRTRKDGEQKDQNESHDPAVAMCALFLEMANIDGEFDPEERERILDLFTREQGLSQEQASDLVAAAQEELDRSIDLWHFSRRINLDCSEAEKLGIIEMLWRIVYTDGNLDKHENYLIRKLSNLLGLAHSDLIDAKLRVLHGMPADKDDPGLVHLVQATP